MKKVITLLMAGIFAGLCFGATPQITNVKAQPRYPWNGKVDITFEVAGDVMAGNTNQFSLTVTDRVTGSNCVAVASAVTGDMGITAGAHQVIWDMRAQGLMFRPSDMMFNVSYTEPRPNYLKYCVIDLSAGASATNYPVTYTDSPPGSGFNTDEYKTTKLVLRRIEPGTFMMCGAYNVTLTNAFYCGIFEVTQRQYELVMDKKPSYFGDASHYAMRPVEQVSYNVILGSSSSASWTSSSVDDASSFLGKLREKTGIDEFDLPTEAQWEYACRAGKTGKYTNGGDSEDDLKQAGRYWDNGGSGYNSPNPAPQYGTAVVGSYQPNAWGLYDMNGNVWEWCLDWYGRLSSGVTDPKGSPSGSFRVIRGGSWSHYAVYCTLSYRDYFNPAYRSNSIGFRLARTLFE